MFPIITNQILKMLFLIIIGYICFRVKLVDHHGNKTLSNILLMIVNPIMIITSLQITYTPSLVKGFLIAFLLSILAHVIGILISKVVCPKGHGRDFNIEQFSGMYSNCGFMGIPLVNSILGSEGILYLTAYIIIFNLFIWTHGLSLMTENTSLKQLKKGLLSPVMFGSLIGLILFFTQIRLPAVVFDSANYIAGMNTPLAMLIAGVSLAETDFLKALKNKNLYRISVCKLLVFPIVILLLFFFLPVENTVLYAVLIAAACPTASTGTMFALRYDCNYKYATEAFVTTTILSLLTIPVIVYLAEQLLH